MSGWNHVQEKYRRAVIIYNPFAGRLLRVERSLQRTIQSLAERGLNATLVPTTGPGTASLLARRHIEEGADLIIAAGGDGTINEVVNGMAHSQVPMAILPGGTANVLAHELGIRRDLYSAALSLADMQPCRISLGVLRGPAGYERFFLMMAGLGLDAQIVYNLDLDLKAVAGKLAYYAGGLLQCGCPLPQFAVRVNDRQYEVGFGLISRVRNYGGDLEIARGASLLRDDFEVVLFEGTSSPGFLRYLAGVTLRMVAKMRGCHVVRATSLTCEVSSDPSVYAQIDGEIACRLPVTSDMAEQALTLRVPSDFRARGQSRRQVPACA